MFVSVVGIVQWFSRFGPDIGRGDETTREPWAESPYTISMVPRIVFAWYEQ